MVFRALTSQYVVRRPERLDFADLNVRSVRRYSVRELYWAVGPVLSQVLAGAPQARRKKVSAPQAQQNAGLETPPGRPGTNKLYLYCTSKVHEE